MCASMTVIFVTASSLSSSSRGHPKSAHRSRGTRFQRRRSGTYVRVATISKMSWAASSDISSRSESSEKRMARSRTPRVSGAHASTSTRCSSIVPVGSVRRRKRRAGTNSPSIRSSRTKYREESDGVVASPDGGVGAFDATVSGRSSDIHCPAPATAPAPAAPRSAALPSRFFACQAATLLSERSRERKFSRAGSSDENSRRPKGVARSSVAKTNHPSGVAGLRRRRSRSSRPRTSGIHSAPRSEWHRGSLRVSVSLTDVRDQPKPLHHVGALVCAPTRTWAHSVDVCWTYEVSSTWCRRHPRRTRSRRGPRACRRNDWTGVTP